MKIPFTPSVYEHAARLVDETPWKVSRDPGLLYTAHRTAYLEYRHTPVVVGIDIYNLEAEAYGAEVSVPSGKGIPAIHRPLFDRLDGALELEPFDPHQDGRIAMVIETGHRLAIEKGPATGMRTQGDCRKACTCKVCPNAAAPPPRAP